MKNFYIDYIVSWKTSYLDYEIAENSVKIKAVTEEEAKEKLEEDIRFQHGDNFLYLDIKEIRTKKSEKIYS